MYSPGPCANGMTGMSGSSTCSGHGAMNGGGCPAAAHHRRSSNPAWNWLPWRPSVADSSSSDINSTLARLRYVAYNCTPSACRCSVSFDMLATAAAAPSECVFDLFVEMMINIFPFFFLRVASRRIFFLCVITEGRATNRVLLLSGRMIITASP